MQQIHYKAVSRPGKKFMEVIHKTMEYGYTCGDNVITEIIITLYFIILYYISL